ncbi:hypothetical protein A3781_17835 [Bacillus badius]|nr:hypothetical protein A3781_17835 [Bacillus badius]
MRDPAGAWTPRRLAARPAESEAPGMERNWTLPQKKKKTADFSFRRWITARLFQFQIDIFYTAILFLYNLLIGMEGAKTPAGAAGQARPRRRFWRRGGSPPAPRKAKRLEWKETGPIHTQAKKDSGQLSFSLTSVAVCNRGSPVFYPHFM